MSIDMDRIEGIIAAHMADQPYSCKCAECGKDLSNIAMIDGDMDLTIEVELCPDCTAVSDD